MRSASKARLAIGVAAVTCVSVGGLSSGAVSADPAGFIPDELEYGYFYGTFDENPNVALFAGGTFEEFCGPIRTAGRELRPFACFRAETARRISR